MNQDATLHPKLVAFEKTLEMPMLVLSFVWLCVLIAELAYGVNPVISWLGNSIWFVFICYFSIRLETASNRAAYLKKNWFFVLAMLVSVLRFFPFLKNLLLVRALTATFGMQVLWIFASADLGMRSLRRALGRRGAGYALVLTLVVLFAGAAGMLHFERALDDPGSLSTYPRALWWTAMQMTNIGTAYSMKTPGGRILCLGISVYAAGMFGYLTAVFATFLIDRDVKAPLPEVAWQKSVQDLRKEVLQMRRLLEEVAASLPVPTPDSKRKNPL